MLSFLFKKNDPNIAKEITSVYKKLKDLYNYNDISEERKAYLEEEINKYGYLRYPHIRALEELSPAETLYGLELKWKKNNVFDDNQFKVENEKISPVPRAKINNADWIKKEQHSIKLINLAALGDGNKTHEIGRFIDWLKQILILPQETLIKTYYLPQFILYLFTQESLDALIFHQVPASAKT